MDGISLCLGGGTVSRTADRTTGCTWLAACKPTYAHTAYFSESGTSREMHVWGVSLEMPLSWSGKCAVRACVGNFRSLFMLTSSLLHRTIHLYFWLYTPLHLLGHRKATDILHLKTQELSAWGLIDLRMVILHHFCTLQKVFINECWCLFFVEYLLGEGPECTGFHIGLTYFWILRKLLKIWYWFLLIC